MYSSITHRPEAIAEKKLFLPVGFFSIATRDLTSNDLVVMASVFFIVFTNKAFFSNVLQTYPLDLANTLFLVSLVTFFTCANIVVLSLICFRVTIKPVLITLLMLSSMAAYFMDNYNIVVSEEMIDNTLNTDTREIVDLLSLKQIAYLGMLGILPSVFVYRTTLVFHPIHLAAISRLTLAGVSLLIMTILVLAQGNQYASFIREHKLLRFYANPTYYLYSAGRYTRSFFAHSSSRALKQIALDANIPENQKQRELIIMVVGETVRADRLSLNGYQQKTNPLLEKENVFSFTNFWSCGTSTAESVPCLFSMLDRDNFDRRSAAEMENVLDILVRSGVNVLWLDNNSDSKGVATRIPFLDYRKPSMNSICDSECRDVGMLSHLQQNIDSYPTGDIFIVLHQMGNHGPAYYKRYPEEFEKFKPACKTNQLEKCTDAEISNAYNNAVRYTDYFLAKTIDLLKNNNSQFETAMFYVSDHGESLGENGIYLHGLPYILAPDVQKRVPVIMWFGENADGAGVDPVALKNSLNLPFSHDNIFHTILGMLEVKTGVYSPELDIMYPAN